MSIIQILKNCIYIIEGYTKWGFDILMGNASKRSVDRYLICKSCEEYVVTKKGIGICSNCGCIIKAKVRVDFEEDKDGKSVDGCPLKKW